MLLIRGKLSVTVIAVQFVARYCAVTHEIKHLK